MPPFLFWFVQALRACVGAYRHLSAARALVLRPCGQPGSISAAGGVGAFFD